MKLLILCIVLFFECSAWATEDRVARKIQNPIAEIIAIPFEFSWEKGKGKDKEAHQTQLSIQPVIPMKLSKDISLIHRGVFPFISQGGGEAEEVSGVNDFLYEGFFAFKFNSIVLGLGPAVNFPIGSPKEFTQNEWASGPAAAIIFEGDPWTIGAAGYHLWSFSSHKENEKINKGLIQSIIAYTNQDDVSFSIQSENEFNNIERTQIGHWIASVEKTLTINKQITSFSFGYKNIYTAQQEEAYNRGFILTARLIYN